MTLKERLEEMRDNLASTNNDASYRAWSGVIRSQDLIPRLALLLQAYVDDDVTEETLERAWAVLKELEKRLK